jgi:hypothetical protein
MISFFTLLTDDFQINVYNNTVWLNKQVKIDKRTIFYPEWFNRGVKFVNDFVNDDGSLESPDPCGLKPK